jgi:hypothetical protein
VRELNGAAAPNVQMTFAKPVATATEVNGQEDVIGAGGISFNGNTATFSLNGFQPKAFAITFGITRINGMQRRGSLGAAAASRSYDISGRRIGTLPKGQLTKIKTGGVRIMAAKDGKERKIVRIVY